MGKTILGYVVVVVATLGVLACGAQVGYVIVNNQNTQTSNNANNDAKKNGNEVAVDTDTEEETTNNDSKKSTPTKSDTNKEVKTPTDEDNKEEETKKENKVISKLKETLNSVKNAVSDADLKGKGKQAIITIVDFLFYDGEINGVTYDELSDSAKENVLALVAKIDDTIESKVPGYKDTINDAATQAKIAVLMGLIKGYSELDDFLYDHLDSEDYSKLIDAEINAITTAFKVVNTVSEKAADVKESTSDALDNLKTKADSWYQNWKNN